MYKSIIDNKQSSRSSSLQEIALQAKMPINKDKMHKILRASLSQLIAQVKTGMYSIEEVKKAFVMRALDIAVESNYLAELYMEDKQMHRSMAKSGMEKIKMEHSLYGMMYSVADWIDMNGYDSTCGLASQALKPVYEDAVMVKVLTDL